MNKKISIIGAGVMGKAIAKALLVKHAVKAKDLYLTNITTELLEEFNKQGVNVGTDNTDAVSLSEIIILAVKPQVMDVILEEIKEVVKDKLIISIAAGISINHIQQILGKDKKIVRVMPNLCASIGESMSCWVVQDLIDDMDKETVKEILLSIGKEIQLKNEDQIDSITPISGSGPAYVFLLAELLEKEAIALGINEQNAKLLARQTIIGSSVILQNTTESFEQLRKNVTSKGGVTEQVIKTFEEKDARGIFGEAIKKGFERSRQLNKLK